MLLADAHEGCGQGCQIFLRRQSADMNDHWRFGFDAPLAAQSVAASRRVEQMGINTTRYKVMAFAIGAGFAGVAGGLFAHCFYIINPSSFTFMASFNYLIMVVLGGLGSITGSIAGAFVVTFVSAALASWPEFRMIIYALVLIFLMFYRPQGLFGYMEITDFKFFKRFKGGRK